MSLTNGGSNITIPAGTYYVEGAINLGKLNASTSGGPGGGGLGRWWLAVKNNNTGGDVAVGLGTHTSTAYISSFMTVSSTASHSLVLSNDGSRVAHPEYGNGKAYPNYISDILDTTDVAPQKLGEFEAGGNSPGYAASNIIYTTLAFLKIA